MNEKLQKRGGMKIQIHELKMQMVGSVSARVSRHRSLRTACVREEENDELPLLETVVSRGAHMYDNGTKRRKEKKGKSAGGDEARSSIQSRQGLWSSLPLPCVQQTCSQLGGMRHGTEHKLCIQKAVDPTTTTGPICWDRSAFPPMSFTNNVNLSLGLWTCSGLIIKKTAESSLTEQVG